MRRVLISLLLGLAVSACLSPADRAAHLATTNGLVRNIVPGASSRHQVFSRLDTDRRALFVFIEGDGLPWAQRGTRPSADPPTTRSRVSQGRACRG
jgi:hypothetical protein